MRCDPKKPGRERAGVEESLDPASVHPLRLHRERRGWSQGDVADQLMSLGYEHGVNLGVVGATVGRWERGVCRPRPPYPRLLCLLFGTTAEELGLAPSRGHHRSGTLDDEMERRRVLRMLAGAAVAPVFVRGQARAAATASREASVDRLTDVLEKPSGTDGGAASVIESCILDARRVDDVLGSRSAVETAVPLRRVVSTALSDGSLDGATRQQLTVAAGDLSQFLAHLAFEMNDRPTSLRYLDEALAIAHETDAYSLGPYVLGWRGNFERHEGHLQQAAAYVESARSWAEAKGSPATRAWLAKEEARGLAIRGDRSGAERALDRARKAFARFRAGEEPPWMYWFSPENLDYSVGSVYAALGFTEPARTSLQKRLATWNPAMVRDRAFVLIRLGETYVPDGEVDEACRHASEALTIAGRTHCDRAVTEVRELRARLKPWERRPSVRDLDDQLAATPA